MPSEEVIHRKKVFVLWPCEWAYSSPYLKWLGVKGRIALGWFLNMVLPAVTIYRKGDGPTYGFIRFGFYYGAIIYQWRYPSLTEGIYETGWKVCWQPTHWNLWRVNPGEKFWRHHRDFSHRVFA